MILQGLSEIVPPRARSCDVATDSGSSPCATHMPVVLAQIIEPAAGTRHLPAPEDFLGPRGDTVSYYCRVSEIAASWKPEPLSAPTIFVSVTVPFRFIGSKPSELSVSEASAVERV